MKTQTKVWIGVGILALILLLWIGTSYNSLVSSDNNVDAKWSEVESQYQRQADLIPNLVSVVSSSVSAETKFVKDVVAARTSFVNAQSDLERESAGVQMDNGISAFVNAVAEGYPELQANAQYVALTDELAGTQNRITVARGDYIQAIQSYNLKVRTFPSNIIAGIFGFDQRDYYHADEGNLETPSLGNGTLP